MKERLHVVLAVELAAPVRALAGPVEDAATQVSSIPLPTFIADIDQGRPMTPEHVFVRYPQGTVGYVMAAAEDHRPVPGAFHYHFHSERPGDMLQFHQRHFA